MVTRGAHCQVGHLRSQTLHILIYVISMVTLFLLNVKIKTEMLIKQLSIHLHAQKALVVVDQILSTWSALCWIWHT